MHSGHGHQQQGYFQPYTPWPPGEEEGQLLDDPGQAPQSQTFYTASPNFSMYPGDPGIHPSSHFDQPRERNWEMEYSQANHPYTPNQQGPRENQYNDRLLYPGGFGLYAGVERSMPQPQANEGFPMFTPTGPGGMNMNYSSGTEYPDNAEFEQYHPKAKQAPPRHRHRPSSPVATGPRPSTPTLTFVQETPGSKPQQFLACYFCRMRKIACLPPPADSPDQRCQQCYRRNGVCEYPTKSNRGIYAREGQSSKEGSSSKKKRGHF